MILCIFGVLDHSKSTYFHCPLRRSSHKACSAREATDLKHPQLTELSPGLLQLLDLILQEEHGHCECQQRQKLKLGRHHDSEQPHQIIQSAMVVSPCPAEETLKHTHTHASGAHKAVERLCMALSPPASSSPVAEILWLTQMRCVHAALDNFIHLFPKWIPSCVPKEN